MPKLGGPEAFAQMTALRPDLPAIFTTGHTVGNSFLERELSTRRRLLAKAVRSAGSSPDRALGA